MFLTLAGVSPAIRKFPLRPEWIELLAGLVAGVALVAFLSHRSGRLERL